MSIDSIHTDRLTLVPITLEIADSLLNGNSSGVEKLGFEPDKNWPTEDTMDILPVILESLKKDKLPSGFETWMIINKGSKMVIGDIGFYGKPDEYGEVEIGYGLVEQERGKGFGFEALKAMIDWAFIQSSVKVIKAECLISNKPSSCILRKAGMKEINRDKELTYWLLDKQNN